MGNKCVISMKRELLVLNDVSNVENCVLFYKCKLSVWSIIMCLQFCRLGLRI